MWELCQDNLSCLFNSNIIMQYDARPKEANDESALLTTSSMQISGAYCHNYGQWEHVEDSVNYALSIFQQLSLTDPSCV